MTFRCMFIFILFGALLAGASDTNRSFSASTDEDMLIGYLEKHGQVIAIYAGDEGPLYTIKTKDGEVIAEKIDEKQLQAKHPDLYRDLKSAVAGNDASLNKSAREPVVIFDDE